MDPISIERIKLMHPAVRKEVAEMYAHINKHILGKGVRLRLAYTYRSPEEQNALYAQGRSKLFDSYGRRMGIVTNAKAFESIHQYGLALDIVLLLDKNGDGTFEAASWETRADFDGDKQADWMEVVNYIKSKGWEWGGDFKTFKDMPHFEKTFKNTPRILKSKLDKGQVITETINGKIYHWPNIQP